MLYLPHKFHKSYKEGNFMATSKSGSTKKATAKKPSSQTTATKTKVTAVTAEASTRKPSVFKKASGEPNFPAIIIAEVIGTFVITLVALLTLQQFAALYVGLTVAVLILAVGAVSGAHLNPAVTFGLWAARRLKTTLVPVYWIAQFIGAILAVLVLGAFAGSNGYGLDFGNFTAFDWGVAGVEVVGTAVFLFGLIAAVSNDKLSQAGKAFGVGLALTVGILVSGAVYTELQKGASAAIQNDSETQVDINKRETIPRAFLVNGATLNPAVALAATEKTMSEISGYEADANEARYSRLGLEVIVGTLVGAALGTNLYLLLAYVNRQQS